MFSPEPTILPKLNRLLLPILLSVQLNHDTIPPESTQSLREEGWKTSEPASKEVQNVLRMISHDFQKGIMV